MNQPISEEKHSGYTRIVGGLTCLLLALTAAVNVLVDPYLRFGTPPIPGLSALKPAAIGQVRMVKAYGVLRQDFNCVLLGNSRVDVGINPGSSEFSADHRPVYNLGQPGTGSDTALTYLKHATNNHRPTVAFVGVDFLSYLQPKNRASTNESQTYFSPDFVRLNLQNEAIPWWKRRMQPVADAFSACLSLSSLQATARTVWAQSNKNAASIDEFGFNSGAAFRDLIRVEGQASLFSQKNQEYIERNLLRIAPDIDESAELKAIEEILAYCQQEKIELYVFTHPYHVDVLEIIDETSHGTALERWKRELVKMCLKYNVPFWDFALVNDWTTEQPPEPKDKKTVMKWYWESGHYRSELGELMVREMLASHTIREASILGVQLTSQNVDEHLKAQREKLSVYRTVAIPHRVELQQLCEKLKQR